MDDDDLLTVREVAERLRFKSERPVYRAIKAGWLRAIRIGRSYRIRWADYRAFITPPPVPREQTRREAMAQRARISRLMRGAEKNS